MRAQFVEKRAILSRAFQSLKTDVDRFEGRCSSVEAGTPADAQCASENAVLENRKSGYISSAKAYNAQLGTALQARVAELTAVIRRDQQAFRNLGIAKSAGQYDDWVDLSAGAERERDEQFKEALHEAGEQILEAAAIEGLEHGLDKVASLNPPKANRLITQLRNAGGTDPYVEDLLRKIASTPGKPDKARYAKELIRRLEQAKHIWNLTDLSDTSDSAKWKAGADILGIFVEDKRLRLIGMLTLDTVRASFYSLNNNIVRRVALSEVEDLTRLSELQLQNLKILSAKLASDVKKLRQAKSEAAHLQ